MTDRKMATLANAFDAPTSEAGAREEEAAAAPRASSTRQGRRSVVVHMDPAAHKQLKMLAVELERSLQSLGVEAYNDLFQKHDKPRIAS